MYTQANSLIGQLCKEDGEIAETNEAKANKHNDWFTSVFTKKNLHNLPNIEMASISNGITLADIIKRPHAIHMYKTS